VVASKLKIISSIPITRVAHQMMTAVPVRTLTLMAMGTLKTMVAQSHPLTMMTALDQVPVAMTTMIMPTMMD